MQRHSITFLLLIVLVAVTVQTVFAQQQEQHHRYDFHFINGETTSVHHLNGSLSSTPECYPPSERSTCHQLSCINGTCQPCRKNSECWERTMICEKDEDGGEDGQCVVMELFERGFDVWMFLTMIIVLSVCVVGVCGGLGGGGILSPAFAGVAGFPMHDAVFLSLATIVGQAIINIPIIMMNYDPEYSPDTKNSLTVERLLERQKERKQIQQEVVREKRQQQEFVESSGPEVINHQFTINNSNNNILSASTLDTKQQNEENDEHNNHDQEPAAALTANNINASTTTVDDTAVDGINGSASPKLSPQIHQKVVGYLSDLENRGGKGRVHFSSSTADADAADDTAAAASAHESHHINSSVVDPVVLEHGPLEDVISIPRSSFHSPRLVPTRPLAAFDILVMWFPACAAGTFVSELISKIIPNWLRMGSLFIVTCFITYRTAKRSYQLRKKEEVRAKKAQRRENGGVEGGGDDDEKLLINRNDGDDAETATTDSGDSIGIDDDTKTVEHLDPFSGCSSVYSMGRQQQSSARKSSGAQKTPQKESSNKQGESAPLLSSAVDKHENNDQNYDSTQQQQQQQQQQQSAAAAMKNDSISRPVIELPGNDNTQNRISLRASLAGAGDDDPLLHLPDDQDDQEGPTFTPHPDSMPRIPIVEIILLILTMAIGVCVAHFVIHGDIFECGSGAYFGLIVVGVLVDLLIALIYRHRVSKIASNVSKGSTHKVRLPCNWNFKNSVVLPLLSGAAGLCSQLFGLGGGSIVAPLLLEAGVSPERVSATGSVLTGILGLQSMLVSVGGDSPPPSWSYIGMFGAIGALSTIIGRFYVLKEIKRRKASWAIVLCLSTILFFTLVASSTNGVINFVALLNYGASIGFGSMCGKGK